MCVAILLIKIAISPSSDITFQDKILFVYEYYHFHLFLQEFFQLRFLNDITHIKNYGVINFDKIFL